MSFSDKLTQLSNTRLNATPKSSTLNPNAAEFFPLFTAATLPAAIETLPRPNSSLSDYSDEQSRQYWSCQLPDDITPDFTDDVLKAIESIPLEALSLDEGTEHFRIASSANSRARLSSASSLNINAKAWDAPASENKLVLPHPYRGKAGDFVDDRSSKSGMVDDSLAFLANQFPACESLAEVFFANQHILNSTVEMLNQLEHQLEVGSNKVTNSKSSSALNPNAPVFHSRAVHGAANNMHIYTRDGLLQSGDTYQPADKDSRLLFTPTSIPTQGSVDLHSGMGNSSLPKSIMWKYEGHGSIDTGIGSSTRPYLPASYIARVSPLQGNVPSPSSANRTFWVGNGEAVGSVHPELREEMPQMEGF